MCVARIHLGSNFTVHCTVYRMRNSHNIGGVNCRCTVFGITVPYTYSTMRITVPYMYSTMRITVLHMMRLAVTHAMRIIVSHTPQTMRIVVMY